MLILPKTVGSYTLQRKLGTGGIAESYLAHGPGGRPAVVRRALPWVTRDASRFASFEARVADLMGARHPFLVSVNELFRADDDVWIVEDHVDGVSLERVLAWCRMQGRTIPPNVFLNVATHACNALEALHGRAGRGTSSEHVLHLAVDPRSVFLTRDGKVVVGGYGLVRSPTLLPSSGASGPAAVRMEYVSPEQAHEDQKLTPASDLFSLGSVLFEALTLTPLFRAGSNVQTLERIRAADVGDALSAVRERLPGLDKVLGRTLAAQPRHRYQRAFVLREDLRGLMSGYSFASIADDTRAFVAPMLTGSPVRAATAEEERTENTAPRFEPFAAPARPVNPSRASADDGAGAIPAMVDPPTLHAIEVEDPSTFPGHGAGARTGAAAPSPTWHTSPLPVRAPTDESTLTGESLLDERHSLALGLLDTTAARIDDADLLEASHPPAAHVPPAAETTAAYIEPPPEVRARLDDLAAVDAARSVPWESTAAYLADAPPEAARAAFPSQAAAGVESTAAHLGLAPLPNEPGPSVETQPIPTLPYTPSPTDLPLPPRLMPAPIPPAPVPQPSAEPAPIPPASPSVTAAPEAPLPPVPSPPVASVAPDAAPPAWAPAPVEPPPPWDPYGADPAPPAAEARGRGLRVVLGAAAAVAALVIGGLWLTADTAEPEDEPVTASTEGAAPPPRLEPIEEPAADVPTEPVADDPAAALAAAAPETPAAPADDAPAAPRSAAPDAPPEAAPDTTPPARTTSSSRAASAARSVPTEDVVARIEPPPRAASARPSAPAPSTPTPDDEAVAVADAAPIALDLDALSDDAQRGQLTRSDAADLEAVETTSPDYTRARRILLTNAQRRSDDAGTRRYLDQLFALGENRYDPVLLAVEARWLVNARRYEEALEKAQVAERNWARIPSEQVFTKKAEIYEALAAATQGRFYEDPDNLELLSGAIHAWDRYRTHVLTKSRTDLAAKADEQVAKLDAIRERLQ